MAYIDTKYLCKCETCRHLKSGKCDTFCDSGESYSPNMFKIPTADVEEVCRCKDCIYNEIGSCTHSQKYDEDNYRADYFCADGTPKERGGEK